MSCFLLFVYVNDFSHGGVESQHTRCFHSHSVFGGDGASVVIYILFEVQGHKYKYKVQSHWSKKVASGWCDLQ